MVNKILTPVVCMAIILLGYFGILEVLWNHDEYLLSTVIGALGGWAFIHGVRNPEHSSKYAEVCVGLGLIGTVVGLSLGLMAVEESGQSVDALKGAFTAFHTTVIGLSWALVLRVQHWAAGGEM